ncbi:MAG: hypothetical protein FJY11_06535 [Bacteroidetes bacterium]|nr:hypothetical protein [Bacteroidota bacterium]
MNRYLNFVPVVLLAVVVAVTGCRKEDEENIISIAGNSNQGWNGRYTAAEGYDYGSYDTGCQELLFQSYARVLFSDGSWLNVHLQVPGQPSGVPAGTYSVSSLDCQQGFNCSFRKDDSKIIVYILESGTITVTKEGAIYTVELDCTISGESGGGTLSGNFTGPFEFVEIKK